jgi:hypothetical protein
MFGYLGLGFPDVDQFPLFFPVLHHRSIVTHSILIPLAFLLHRHQALRFGASGFVLGVSIHLAADVLSPPTGFGAVWLPWPIKIDFGYLSPVWLAGNAIVGLVWAKTLFLRLEKRSPLTFFWVLAWILAPSYAIFHEDSLLPLGSFAIVFGLSWLIAGRLSRQEWFDRLPKAAEISDHEVPLEVQPAASASQAETVQPEGAAPENVANATPWIVVTSLAIIVFLIVGMSVGGAAPGVAGLLSVGVLVLARRLWRNRYRDGGM